MRVNFKGLGLTASGRRNIRSGAQYAHLYPLGELTFKDPIIAKNADAYDTVALIQKIVYDTMQDVAKIAPLMQGKNLQATCRNIFDYHFNHFQYKEDDQNFEELRRPSRSFRDRTQGIDCDCFTISISAMLCLLGIEHYLKVIQTNKFNAFHHIYVVVPKQAGLNIKQRSNYWVIDPVLHGFDQEAPGIVNQFVTPMKVKFLNGFGIAMSSADKAALQQELLTKVNTGKITSAEASRIYTATITPAGTTAVAPGGGLVVNTDVNRPVPSVLNVANFTPIDAGGGVPVVVAPGAPTLNHGFWWIKKPLKQNQIDFINNTKKAVADGLKWIEINQDAAYNPNAAGMVTFMRKWLKSFDAPEPYNGKTYSPQQFWNVYWPIWDTMVDAEERRRKNENKGLLDKAGDLLGDAVDFAVGVVDEVWQFFKMVSLFPLRQAIRAGLALNVFDSARKIQSGRVTWAEAQKNGLTLAQWQANVANNQKVEDRWKSLGGNVGDLRSAVNQGAASSGLKLGALGADPATVAAGVSAGAAAITAVITPIIQTSTAIKSVAKVVDNSGGGGTSRPNPTDGGGAGTGPGAGAGNNSNVNTGGGNNNTGGSNTGLIVAGVVAALGIGYAVTRGGSNKTKLNGPAPAKKTSKAKVITVNV